MPHAVLPTYGAYTYIYLYIFQFHQTRLNTELCENVSTFTEISLDIRKGA